MDAPVEPFSEPSPENAAIKQERLEEQLTTSLSLAGDEIASCPKPGNTAYALPADARERPIVADFAWLTPILALLQQALTEDPRRADLLRLLPQGLGSGDILPTLFANLFPEQRERHKVSLGKQGERILTDKQVETLRSIALGADYTVSAQQSEKSQSNISQLMARVRTRLNVETNQQAIAVAISMGYLRMNVMDFVRETAHCGPRDYSTLDSMLSYLAGAMNMEDPQPYQQVAAFGLMLMVGAGVAMGNEAFVASPHPSEGAIYRMEGDWNRSLQVRLLTRTPIRRPQGLVIAPPCAARCGFVPGNLFVVTGRETFVGMNDQEIQEFTPGGEWVQSFCGGATYKTGLQNAHGLAFSDGGQTVSRLIDGCWMAICMDKDRHFVVAHWSTRGGTLGIYSEKGKLLRTIGPLPAGQYFTDVHASPNREIEAIAVSNKQAMMQFFSTRNGEELRSWRLKDASCEKFVVHDRGNLFLVPSRRKNALLVYSREGTLQETIPLPEPISPRSVVCSRDGICYLIGSVLDA